MSSRYSYYENSPPYSSCCYNEAPPLPFHLCFFIITLLLFRGLSWYLRYESALESFINNLKLFLMLSPLVLLLAVHWLSGEGRRRPSIIPLPAEREALYRAGGSPWGVGLILLLLMFMISYQSYLRKRWFPLLSR